MSAKIIARQIEADEKGVRTYITSLATPQDANRKRLFTFMLILIPILFFVLLEIALRIGQYGGNLDLFISGEADVTDYYQCNRNVAKRYFFIQHSLPAPQKDLFLKKKPANGYRVFVLGGSTTAGFPYGNNVMFSRILEYRLASSFPDKRIEVVNVAMSAICSYTLADFMDEILAHEADAVFIYAGHNEFYGALGVASMESLGTIRPLVKFYLKMSRCRTFLLVRDVVGLLKRTFTKSAHSMAQDATATLMERIVADKTIPYHSALYALGQKQFQGNLTDIFQKCKQAHVPVLISELVSNIRDQAPFISDRTGIDPAADKFFQSGRKLETEGQFLNARNAYLQAKDLDQLRFRATEDFNGVIHDVARQFDVPVVAMKSFFESSAPHGLVGNSLMTDHLHPNISGYFLMAEAFYNTMKEKHFVQDAWPEWKIDNATLLKSWGITALDSLYADLSIRYLKGGWPFKSKSTPNTSLNNFSPRDKMQELALRSIVDKEFSLELAHVELAQYYEKQGEMDLAFKEYRALIYMVPDEGEFFEKAARINIYQKDYTKAYNLLKQAQLIRESAFASKWIGQILLIQGRIHEAIPYLEKSRATTPADVQLLYNLSRAYLLTMQMDEADAVGAELHKLDATQDSELASLKQKMLNVAQLLKNAGSQLKQKNMDAAIPILLQTLKLHETYEANRWLGEIYLQKHEPAKAILFLERAQRQYPNEPHLLYNLATAYFLEKRIDKAREVYQMLQKIQPDFQGLSDLGERLR